MSKSISLYVGLDVHKDSVDIAFCEAQRSAEPTHLGTVAGGLEVVTKALVGTEPGAQAAHCL